MALKACVLASGSAGNCTYVGTENTGILVDAGLSCRQTGERLAALGEDLAGVAAICVTHEHGDHTSGLGVIHRRFGVELFGNTGTIEAIEQTRQFQGLRWNVFTTGAPFDIGDLRVEPFSVPHDAYDPVGFVMSSQGFRLGIVTDMGMVTELIRQRLRGCHVLVMEANHDEDMLKAAKRPWSLKQRIAGRQGHLSNRQAGELIGELRGPHLNTVFLAHLSSDCNRPSLAVTAVQRAAAAAGAGNVRVEPTYADRASAVVELS